MDWNDSTSFPDLASSTKNNVWENLASLNSSYDLLKKKPFHWGVEGALIAVEGEVRRGSCVILGQESLSGVQGSRGRKARGWGLGFCAPPQQEDKLHQADRDSQHASVLGNSTKRGPSRKEGRLPSMRLMVPASQEGGAPIGGAAMT